VQAVASFGKIAKADALMLVNPDRRISPRPTIK